MGISSLSLSLPEFTNFKLFGEDHFSVKQYSLDFFGPSTQAHWWRSCRGGHPATRLAVSLSQILLKAARPHVPFLDATPGFVAKWRWRVVRCAGHAAMQRRRRRSTNQERVFASSGFLLGVLSTGSQPENSRHLGSHLFHLAHTQVTVAHNGGTKRRRPLSLAVASIKAELSADCRCRFARLGRSHAVMQYCPARSRISESGPPDF